MGLSLGTEYSLFIMSITLIFISSQEFASKINTWIEGCILHSNWTTPTFNGSCSPLYTDLYRIILKENRSQKRIVTDTYELKYSYVGLNEFSNYSFTVQPCAGSSNISSSRNITAQATSSSLSVTAKESENLSVVCPFHGAYTSVGVTEWQHLKGVDNTTIRMFTSKFLQLHDIEYKDSGLYHCTVEYIPCGDNSGISKQGKGFMNVTFEGPPLITSVVRTHDLNREDSLTYVVSVISLSGPPERQIEIEDEYGNKTYVNSSEPVHKYISYTAYGKTFTAQGYEMKFTLGVSKRWSKDLSIVVTNTNGFRIYKSIPVTDSIVDNNNLDLNFIIHNFFPSLHLEIFFDKNKHLVYGVSSGSLLFIILVIFLAIVCCMKRKRKKKSETNGVELVDSLYARPFSNKLYEEQQGNCDFLQGDKIFEESFIKLNIDVYNFTDNTVDRMELDLEIRIEKERKEIASLYSFGGFSISEFQEEEVAYGNDRGTKYGNIV
ncbi:uncharacterized protein LOC133173930 [Saccostrea echinata]|uniref:uncharacterized protein LOC133173930 n=1 Tax=Saccostrea echinata TaxID=191078 RepID=UPI002A832008|nr:uncharacterized protein LOC133173930 [Saccostrea echinata]